MKEMLGCLNDHKISVKRIQGPSLGFYKQGGGTFIIYPTSRGALYSIIHYQDGTSGGGVTCPWALPLATDWDPELNRLTIGGTIAPFSL